MRSNCIALLSLGKPEAGNRSSRTILYDALNGQTASSNLPCIPHLNASTRSSTVSCIYKIRMRNADCMGWAINIVSDRLPVSRARTGPFQENHHFSSVCNTEAVGRSPSALFPVARK